MFSTRRAVQENAPEPLRGALLGYRKDLKLRVVDERTQEAFLWLCGSPEGQRLTDFLRWAGTARINRALVRGDLNRRRVHAELCRVVRRMQRRLGNEEAFNRDKVDAEKLFLDLRVLFLAPIAGEQQKQRKVSTAAAAERQQRLDSLYREHRPSIAAAVSAVLRKNQGRPLPQKTLFDLVEHAPELASLRAELAVASRRKGESDKEVLLERARVLKLFPDLFPTTRGPKSRRRNRPE